MPRFRSDLSSIIPYQPGTPIEEAARQLGLTEIVKLASNENPLPPFPEVQDVVAAALAGANRYPDNECSELRAAVAAHLSVAADNLWFGNGSAALMMVTALGVGGPGTSVVYGWPSFGLYRIAAQTAFSERIEVPLDRDQRYDLPAMTAALRSDTTLVFVCNPNNPTGTHVDSDAVRDFVAALPDEVLVVVDEAYYEYVQAPEYGTALPLALEADNVLVSRTFSKVYGLAGLRCGYMVGHPETIRELRRVQAPFTVSSIAQAAATAALACRDRVAERVQRNAEALKLFGEELSGRGFDFAESVTNFVFMHPGARSEAFDAAMARNGIVVRPWAQGWVRVTVGTEADNAKFFAALDEVSASA